MPLQATPPKAERPLETDTRHLAGRAPKHVSRTACAEDDATCCRAHRQVTVRKGLSAFAGVVRRGSAPPVPLLRWRLRLRRRFRRRLSRRRGRAGDHVEIVFGALHGGPLRYWAAVHLGLAGSGMSGVPKRESRQGLAAFGETRSRGRPSGRWWIPAVPKSRGGDHRRDHGRTLVRCPRRAQAPDAPLTPTAATAHPPPR